MNSTRTICFAPFPIRVVQPTAEPFTYVDPACATPQIADALDVIREGDIEGHVYYSPREMPLDRSDREAIRSILRAVAVEVAAERDACARMVEKIGDEYVPGLGAFAGSKIAAAIRGEG
jgi:hypothetical protein